MPHVVVDKAVPPDVRQYVTGRHDIVYVWNRLYDDLEDRYAQFYTARNPDDERQFVYTQRFTDENSRRVELRFLADDTTAQGVVFVLSVAGLVE